MTGDGGRALKIRDELNPDYNSIPDIADATWTDDILDVRLDRVVVGDVDCVAGVQDMLGGRTPAATTESA